MNYSGYRNKWDDEDSRRSPLKLDRKRVILELEVDATVTDYNSHQIVLSHPDMDGTLIFDVESLEQAEDALDELQMEVEAQFEIEEEQRKEPEKPKITEPARVNPFPQQQYYYAPPRPDPKPQPKSESTSSIPPNQSASPRPEPAKQVQPEPKTIDVSQHMRRADYDPETHPFMSIVTDIGEICDLIPRIFNRKKK